MWLNTKAEGEQVLMNHKQPQDSGAPAPHINSDNYYYYYYYYHSFLLLYHFSDSLAVAKTTACYLRSDQHVLAEGLPR